MKNQISTMFRDRTTPLAVLVGVVLVAMFLGSLLVTTTDADDATGKHGSPEPRPVVTAAVVNEDVPVEVEGQTVPLGRQLSGALVNSDEPDVNWVLTNETDARQGLSSGEYSVLATIPEDFSATATSGATGPPADARSASITVENSPVVKAADADTARRLVDSSLHKVGSMVTETYLDTVFVGFNDMHDQLGQAADGAAQLTDGTAQLSDGADELAGGTAQLSDGTARLSDGADELAGGTAQLSVGLGELSGGASELSDGLGQLEQETVAMPGQTARLADGAGQVADGVHELQTTAAPGLESALAALDRLPAGLVDVPEVQQARGELTTMQAQLNALDSGARQVAEGTQALDDGSAQLVDAVGQAATGAQQLSDGLVEADNAAGTLTAGASQLSDGLVEANDASGALAAGASQLGDGATDAHEGASSLSEGLASAVDEVPTYPDEDRGTLSAALASPVDGVVSSSAENGAVRGALLVLAVVFLLFAAAAAYFQFTRALPSDIVTASGSTGQILRSGLATRLVLSTGVALIVTVLAVAVLSLSAAATAAVFSVAWVGAVMFILVSRALFAVFPRGGILLALSTAVLGVLGGATSLLPGPVAGLVSVLPSTSVAGALRGVLNADVGTVGAGVAGTMVWAAVAAAVVWVAANRKRLAAE